MKTVAAEAEFEIKLHCPYCGTYQIRTDELRDSLDYGELRAEECEKILKCEYCPESFEVNKILF